MNARYPTIYTVTHSCGHTEEHDLREVEGPKRLNRAKYRSGGPCSECYRAGERRAAEEPSSQSRPANVATTPSNSEPTLDAAQRGGAVTLVPGANEWYQRRPLPALEGAAQEIELAARYRAQILGGAWNVFSAEGWEPNEFLIAIEQPASKILDAQWWIEHRLVSPERLVDVFEAYTPAEHESSVQ